MLTQMLLPSRWASQRRQGEMLCKQETERAEKGQGRRPEGLGWKRKGWRKPFVEVRRQKVIYETLKFSCIRAYSSWYCWKLKYLRVLSYVFISGFGIFLVRKRKTRSCKREMQSLYVHVSGLLGQLNQLGHAAYTSQMIPLPEVCPLFKFALSSDHVILIPGP